MLLLGTALLVIYALGGTRVVVDYRAGSQLFYCWKEAA
jgi:hypothetical protein